NASADPEVAKFFARCDIPTVLCPLQPFPLFASLAGLPGQRATIGHLRQLKQARARLREAIAAAKPDIVHLNSLSLAPYACVSRSMGIPTIVHAREHMARGHLGVGRAWVGRCLDRDADRVIAICR
ncbi:MAG: glycosyltransferase, partial [Chloroflexi bacterium]|nr:glycosyltransferase [Chloroflexota bacterium]